MDFSKAIENSQKLPQRHDDAERDIPDFLNTDPVTLAARARGIDDSAFPGVTVYDAQFFSRRFIMGQVVDMYDKGNPIMRDVDESKDLKEIMDRSLRGEAIVTLKKENILRDGTVVVWIEWAEKRSRPKKEDREYLTEAELRTPSPATEEPSDEAGEETT